MTTTAEGVETKEPRRLLRALGCTDMQRHLLSTTQPLDLLARHRVRHADSARTASAEDPSAPLGTSGA